jgi:hypothetical protein
MPCLNTGTEKESLQTGLAAFWDFSLSAGTHTIHETAGRSLDSGTIQGTYSWEGYWYGPVVQATAISGVIELPSPDLGAPTSGAWTVAIKARWGTKNELIAEGAAGALMRDNSTGAAGNILVARLGPEFFGDLIFRAGGNDIETDKNIVDVWGEDVMYVLTTDGEIARLYFDGVEVGSGYPGVQAPISPWYIFEDNGVFQYANIGFAAMWERCLSPEEVWVLSSPGLCREELVLPIEEISGMDFPSPGGTAFYLNWHRRFTGG